MSYDLISAPKIFLALNGFFGFGPEPRSSDDFTSSPKDFDNFGKFIPCLRYLDRNCIIVNNLNNLEKIVTRLVKAKYIDNDTIDNDEEFRELMRVEGVMV